MRDVRILSHGWKRGEQKGEPDEAHDGLKASATPVIESDRFARGPCPRIRTWGTRRSGLVDCDHAG